MCFYWAQRGAICVGPEKRELFFSRGHVCFVRGIKVGIIIVLELKTSIITVWATKRSTVTVWGLKGA